MLCPRCGAEVGEEITICDKCRGGSEGLQVEEGDSREDKQEDHIGISSEDSLEDDSEVPVVEAEFLDEGQLESSRDAGFLLRAIASIFDCAVLVLVLLLLVFLVLGSNISGFLELFLSLSKEQLQERQVVLDVYASALALMGIVSVFCILISWLYFAFSESCFPQATLGKSLLGLKVVDLGDYRIGFLRATGRYFSKFISLLFLGLGFFLVLFNARKQALHDILARTLVVKKNDVSLLRILFVFAFAIFLLFAASYLWRYLFLPAPDTLPSELAGLADDKTPASESAAIGQGEGETQGIDQEAVKTSSFSYSAEEARSTAALWNRQENLLEVGFYSQVLHTLDLAELRSNKSLLAVSEKQPDVVLQLELRPGGDELSVLRVKQYSILFYNLGESEELLLEGSPKVRLNYLLNADTEKSFPILRGYLGESELVLGHAIGEELKQEGNRALSLSWNLPFDAEIIDVDLVPARQESREKASETPEEAGVGPEDKGPYARIYAGGLTHEFADYFALYYPSEGDVAIGFFSTKLSTEEKAQIVKNRVLWRYVNNKHPNLVLHLDFKRDSKTPALENLLAYTVYFYRDKVGSFYFPGRYDRLSFKRLDVEFLDNEVRSVEGKFEDGQIFSLILSGKHISKNTARKHSWDINISLPLNKVPDYSSK